MQHVIKGHIKSYWRMEIKIHRTIWLQAFLSPRLANISQCSNHWPQRAQILTRRSNLTPQQTKNSVNDLPVVSRLTSHLSLFSPANWQAAVGSLLRSRIDAILPNFSLLLNALIKTYLQEEGSDRYLGTSIRESAKNTRNRTAKHKKL